ncbi:MAG: glycosyltransferase family 4 protein [Verrucomicrobiales bacterium]
MPLAYLFSRYPVVSQTFCDSEMLALEAGGRELMVASLNPPTTSFRHERLRDLQAEVVYPPPALVLKAVAIPPAMMALAKEHDSRYGGSFKAGTRARNAAWLAPMLVRRGVRHVHVHFANRATHTALFLKKAGFTFSFTAHAQDYMVDLGSDDLLRELAREAEFVIAVSDFSRDDLRRRCPDRADVIHRVYNGLDPAAFPACIPGPSGGLRVVSVGRLIEFKGFHHLIDAVGRLRDRQIDVTLDIIGEGPWRDRLTRLVEELGLVSRVHLLGVLSQEAIKVRLSSSDVFALACCIDEKGASDILPTVIMEAMAARLPVVSTQVAGVPEMVISETTGLVVPPDDPGALAEALARLANHPDERARFGRAGRARCESLFAQEMTMPALLRHFDAVTPSPPGGTSTSLLRAPAPAVLVLSAEGTESEWQTLATMTAQDLSPNPVGVLAAAAANGDSPPWREYLPDALVLEAAWRAHPQLAERCEHLYASLDGMHGEIFFREARRAVHTSELVRKCRYQRVHAARSETILWAWLVKHLTGVLTTATVEANPACPRSLLTRLLADFDAASIADEKVRHACPVALPDWLALAPPPKRRWGRSAATPAADHSEFLKFLLGDPTAPHPEDMASGRASQGEVGHKMGCNLPDA